MGAKKKVNEEKKERENRPPLTKNPPKIKFTCLPEFECDSHPLVIQKKFGINSFFLSIPAPQIFGCLPIFFSSIDFIFNPRSSNFWMSPNFFHPSTFSTSAPQKFLEVLLIFFHPSIFIFQPPLSIFLDLPIFPAIVFSFQFPKKKIEVKVKKKKDW
jgi:hypothetical protein